MYLFMAQLMIEDKNIWSIKNIVLTVYVPVSSVWGDLLDDLISKSKIVLSIYYNEVSDLTSFDYSQLSPLICKKTVIVVEK